MTTDSKINNLQPGESVIISEGSGIIVTAERSTKNKRIIRFVRTFPCGSFEVFKTINL